MFIYTAKLNKRKIMTVLIILAVVLCAVIILTGLGSGSAREAASLSAVVKDNGERVAYLRSLGWEVGETPVEEQTIIIPTDFSGVYEDYVRLQQDQGFDLAIFAGLEAVRYTYEIYNYPNTSDTVVADIIVYRNEIIAGDIKSTAMDGFMEGLERPSGFDL